MGNSVWITFLTGGADITDAVFSGVKTTFNHSVTFNLTNWSALYDKLVAIEDHIEYLESVGFDVDGYKEVTP